MYLVVNLMFQAGIVPEQFSPGQVFKAAELLVKDGMALVFIDSIREDIQIMLLVPHKRR